jgi:multidrug resistance efflux pump
MSVTVSRERPDQRRRHRVSAPFFITLDGEKVRCDDWSLNGFRVDDFALEPPVPGEQVTVQCSLPFQGFEVSFDARCEIVRSNPETGNFAARFVEIGERETELMSHFLEELVRGSTPDVADTIQRIDVPVNPASVEPKKKVALSQIPIRRWPMKAVALTSFYVVLGTVIFGYAGLLAYSNFCRLEVTTAVITAPIETVTSQADGTVAWNGVAPGDLVSSGQVVINVTDSQMERDIELAHIAVNERKEQYAFYRKRLDDELARMKSFSTVEDNNLDQTRLDLESTKAQLQAAEQQFGRLVVLHRKGYTTDTLLEDAEKLMLGLRAAVASKEVELKSRIDIAQKGDGKWFYTGQTMVGDLSELQAQVKLAEHEVALTQAKYDALVNAKHRLAVRAPFDGTVLEIKRNDQGTVRRGDIIAVFEQRAQRLVMAFVNQDDVSRAGVGDEVLIYVPALGETLKGRVAQIDRTSGFVQEQNLASNPGYRWRGNGDRSAQILIAFEDTKRVSNTQKYRPGLPVTVVFPQHSNFGLYNIIKQRLSTVI